MTKFATLAAGALALFAAHAAAAYDYHVKDLTILNPWARPAAQGQNGAVYLTIKNAGKDTETFISAETPLAEKAELHETRDEDGVMSMRPVKDGIAIKPGASVEFKPGGYHIMLFGLKKPLEEGGVVPLTITLAKAGAVTVEIKVETAAPQSSHAHHPGAPGMDHTGH